MPKSLMKCIHDVFKNKTKQKEDKHIIHLEEPKDNRPILNKKLPFYNKK